MQKFLKEHYRDMVRQLSRPNQKYKKGERVMVKTNLKGLREKRCFCPCTVEEFIENDSYWLDFNGKKIRRNELQMKAFHGTKVYQPTNTSVISKSSKKCPSTKRTKNRPIPQSRYPKRKAQNVKRYGFESST